MITMTDLFCGAGGSGLGATSVPGVRLVMAANHSPLAIRTHQRNFPDTDHDIADISQVEPRRYASTDILWASPECTNHSQAKGRKRSAQPDLFTAPDELAERSRATMWDVPRFAEVHRYPAVIVENVVDAAKWEMFPAWLMSMRCLGYAHRIVWLNSMHAPAIAAPRAPQSRDRMYVVFWREGNTAPDLDIRPPADCPACGPVAAIQWWKRPDRARWGRYRAQYLYRCPTPRCHQVVEPHALPAAAAIDWDLPGTRIGDRVKPLEPATLSRIRAGLLRYGRPLVVPAGGTWNATAAPASDPLRTRTTRETDALVVPVEGRDRLRARPTGDALRTQTARLQDALVVPYYRTGVAHTAHEPLPTMGTVDTAGVAFIAELRGGGSRDTARDVGQPLATVCAGGQHHMLVRQNTPRGNPAQMCTPVTEPARTITTAGHQSLVGWPEQAPMVEDCTFRMLAVHEIQAAMAFTPDYVVEGTNKRDRVRQLGNAVTPPAAEWLIRAVTRSLGAGA
jgi:DNA (cytosine-5)-methyltransferase 1